MTGAGSRFGKRDVVKANNDTVQRPVCVGKLMIAEVEMVPVKGGNLCAVSI